MKRLILLHLFALALCLQNSAAAETTSLPFVSPVIGDHMVLQREKPNRIWGWTQPGAEISVRIADQTTRTKAAADGKWQVEFNPPPAGGPYTLVIDGPKHVEFNDILVGDVWLCSGQSNMEMGLTRARNGEAEAKAASHPGIRLYHVGTKCTYEPASLLQGKWQVCEPQVFTTGNGFSAVAYYFGRKIHAETGIPIGLIQSAVGGTPAESWTSTESLRRMPEFVPALDEIARLNALGGEQYGNYISHWYDAHDRGQKENWGAATLDDSTWKTTSLKTAFADLGVPEHPAVCWLRREIMLPAPLPAGTAKILLGVVEKMDTVFINGSWIGASSWVENPRVYAIGAGVLKPGKNQVTIRVLKTKPDGGFTNPPADLKIALGDGTTIPLEGTWKGAVSVDARPPHPLPFGYENYPTMPTVLYNAMVHPIAPLALTGAIWYQGEANQFKPHQYRNLLTTMIADWRRLFAQGDFPFYIASLPAFMERQANPPAFVDGWTRIREAQAQVADTVANTGVAVTVDTGDAKDIHPTEKQPVGERLALLALRDVYKRDVVATGPVIKNIEILPGQIRIQFSNTEGGLVCDDTQAGAFAVAGEDRIWHWAQARVEDQALIVSSNEVPSPVAVRYAWQANPPAPLKNGSGLPAAPFRSDNW